MKSLFLSLVFLLSVSTAQADNHLFTGKVFSNLCASSVTDLGNNSWALNRPQIALTSEGLYYTARAFREMKQWSVNFTADGQTSRQIMAFSESINDIAVIGENVWLLFNDHVLVINTANREVVSEIKTTTQPLSDPGHERAFEMTVDGGKLYVAQGSLGVSVIDIATQSLEKTAMLGLRVQPDGHWSKAVGVAHANGNLYLTIDGVTVANDKTKPLNGVIVASQADLDSYHSINIDQASSGVVTMVMTSQVHNNSLVMNNWGFLQTVSLASLQAGAKSFDVTHIMTPSDYQAQSYQAVLQGDVMISGNQYFACGKISPDDMVNHIPKRVGVVQSGSL